MPEFSAHFHVDQPVPARLGCCLESLAALSMSTGLAGVVRVASMETVAC